MSVLISGNHEVVTTRLPDLRSLKFTHTKQRGAKHIYEGRGQSLKRHDFRVVKEGVEGGYGLGTKDLTIPT